MESQALLLVTGLEHKIGNKATVQEDRIVHKSLQVQSGQQLLK